MKPLEIIVVAIALMLAKCTVEAGTEPINTNTADGKVKLTSSGTGAVDKPFNWRDVSAVGFPLSVTFVVDGVGSVVSTGTKNPIKIPRGGILVGWTLMGKPSGSVTVDILRAANTVGLPVTSIIGSGTKPALSSAVENSSTTLTGWTSTTLFDKDNLAISLSGISSVTYVELTLYFK